MNDPNWHDFDREEKKLLKELDDPKNNWLIQRWLLKFALRLCKSAKRELLDLRSGWK